ncbi:MAG: DUF445 domain-containing protein [Nevskia sp.]|nr:DUF445 domain-containing protein [Nevskia sp.]
MPIAKQADPDVEARRSLRWHRAFAGALLVLMGALILLGYALPPSSGADLLQAAAKAGFVGGIADWFAVTALFRRPLGLPIPHTAIIPLQKERLGRALGNFVASHVFTHADVATFLAQLDLASILRRFLSNPVATRPAAEALAAMLPRILASIEDGRARHMLARIVPRILGGPGAGRVVARALRQLVEGGKHQDVFTFIDGSVKTTLASREASLQAAIEERVREQGGRLVGWALGAAVAHRVVAQINTELSRMEPDSSEMRAAFDEWVRRDIQRIEDDPERAAEIGAAVKRVVAHETVRAWLADVWSRLRLALEADAARPDGRTIAVIEGALANLGGMLEQDPASRDQLHKAVEGIAASLLPSAQAQLAEFIAGVVGRWDTATVTEKLELRIGSDLQYVRVNGTLVGFLVGGLLYAVLQAIFGHVAF